MTELPEKLFCKCKHGKPCADTIFEIEQWHDKAIATARAEGAAEERNKLVKIIEEQIGRIPTNGGIMDIFMGDDGFTGKWIDRDILLEALTTKESSL